MTKNTREDILNILIVYGPATDEEIFGRLHGVSPSGARTRRAELVANGLVRATGEKRTTASGRLTAVWDAAAVQYADPHVN